MEKINDFNISLENFIDSFPEAIYIKNKNGEIVLANKAYSGGIKTGTSLGLKDENIIKDTEELKFITKTEEMILNKREIAYDIFEKITIDGHTRLNSTTKVPLTDENGDPTHIMGISRDISGRVHLYKMLFDSFQGCCFITTKKEGGRWLAINQEGCRIFGWRNDIEHFKNQTKVIDFYENNIQRKNFIEDIEKTGYVHDYHMRLRKKDKKLFDARVTASVRRNEKTGEVIGYHGIIHDVTEQKEKERQFRKRLEYLRNSISKEIENHMRLFLQDELLDSMPSLGTLEELDKKIYFLLIQKKTNKEIAKILHMNHRNIEHYRKRIYDELLPKTTGRRDINDLLVFAKRNGHI